MTRRSVEVLVGIFVLMGFVAIGYLALKAANLAAMTIGFFAASMTTARLTRRYGGGRVITAGAATQGLGLAIIATTVLAGWPELTVLALVPGASGLVVPRGRPSSVRRATHSLATSPASRRIRPNSAARSAVETAPRESSTLKACEHFST